MRIIVYATSFSQTGGLESHLVKFCTELKAQGHSITFICGNFQANPDWAAALKKVACCLTAQIKNSKLRQLWLIRQAIILRGQTHSALYTNGQGSSVMWIGRLFSHSTWVHHHHMAADEEDCRHWTALYQKALRQCDRLVACANLNADRLKQAIGREADVVYCFSQQLPAKGKIQAEGRKLRFGYFGRLIAAKGLPIILRLAEESELGDIEWHIWGTAGDFELSKLENAKNVFYHGIFSSVEGLKKAVNSLDAFTLFTTFREGLPISLIEATGAGLPWIASDRGGIRELGGIEKATILLSPSPSYEECLSACRQMADDIKCGNINNRKMIELYENRFATNILMENWLQTLGSKGHS
mgnify:CR=1 FL=1